MVCASSLSTIQHGIKSTRSSNSFPKSDGSSIYQNSESKQYDDVPTAELIMDHNKSINHDDDDDDDESAILQRSVKRLHFGSMDEKVAALIEIKRLAKDDLTRRKLMADLGVIPPLVAMVGSEYTTSHRRLAVQALLELANGTCTDGRLIMHHAVALIAERQWGTCTNRPLCRLSQVLMQNYYQAGGLTESSLFIHTRNKAFMVEAGILTKLSGNINVKNPLAKHEFAQLIMSISSLVKAQFPITSSKVLPLLLHMLESDSSIDTKMLCLGTLYNLSTVIDNVGPLAKDEVVHVLLKLLFTKETSEKALATLGNLVVTLTGKKALESSLMVPECLIEVLTWDDKSKCQELSVYILMMLAYQSSLQRTKMAKGGIVPILLQVALLGSPLAQKRALKLLQWFKDERQMKIGPHSGPQSRRLSFGSPTNQEDASEGKRLMKDMVQKSLYKNMETITRRANKESDSNKFKVLVPHSSSKSLPY